MRKKSTETTEEETPQAVSDLYIPSWALQNGPFQPLATPLPLDMGKNLCLQNFLQRCRNIKLGLPAEQQVEVPTSAIERLALEWNLMDSGNLKGEPTASLPSPLASTPQIVYMLQPVR